MNIRWTPEAAADLEQGTRELVLSPLPYIVVYRVKEKDSTVEILHIYHGAQDR